MASVGFAGLLFPETLQRPMPNILPCRHRTIPLHEGVRLVTNPWDALWPSTSTLDTLVSSQSPLHQLRHLFPSSSFVLDPRTGVCVRDRVLWWLPVALNAGCCWHVLPQEAEECGKGNKWSIRVPFTERELQRAPVRLCYYLGVPFLTLHHNSISLVIFIGEGADAFEDCFSIVISIW